MQFIYRACTSFKFFFKTLLWSILKEEKNITPMYPSLSFNNYQFINALLLTITLHYFFFFCFPFLIIVVNKKVFLLRIGHREAV